MTEKEYYVGGCTALLDAVGGAIHHIGSVHKYIREEDRPEHTMFIITTDGCEFIFLGANIDAIEAAGRIGIKEERAVEYHSDSKGTSLNYKIINEAVSCLRASEPLPSDWKSEIEEDYKKRRR